MPGVGQYDLIKSMDFAMVTNPSIKIGKSHRESINKELTSLPGPGYYEEWTNSTASMTKRNSPRAFIGDSGRNEMNKTITNLPGPSNYRPFKGFGYDLENYQKISIGKKFTPRSKQNSPGPIYNTIEASAKVKSRQPAFVMSKTKKL